MDFEFSEEQKMMKNTARDFAENEIMPRATEDDIKGTVPWDIIEKMKALGFLGASLPEEYGGGGIDNIAYALMTEEIGRASQAFRTLLSAHLSLCSRSIVEFGNDEQKKRYLPKLAAGQFIGCFATTEPNVGSDIASIETTADPKNDSWVLNGNKIWISNGGIADIALVFAQTDKSQGRKGIAAFLVDKGTPGFTSAEIHNKLGLRSGSTAELSFDQCQVPAENMLGKVGDGFRIAMAAFDRARMSVAAGCVGLGQACIDASVQYAQTRTQFGRLIGSYQLIQAIIADMIVEIDAARLLVYRCAYLKDKGLPNTIETSMAKYYASEAASRAANKAIQIHGSYGFSGDYPVERYYRDIRATTILEGTSQMHQLIIGRNATGISAFSG